MTSLYKRGLVVGGPLDTLRRIPEILVTAVKIVLIVVGGYLFITAII